MDKSIENTEWFFLIVFFNKNPKSSAKNFTEFPNKIYLSNKNLKKTAK